MPRKRHINIFTKNNTTYDPDIEKENNAAKILIAIVINLVLFFYVAFQTLIPTTIIICIYLLLPVIVYFILKLLKIPRPGFKSMIRVPYALNIILLLNYFISFNPKQETYYYHRNTQVVFSRFGYRSYSQNSTGITLENNAYDKYYGIRTFLSEENIKGGYQITYTFKTGILGIRVMTDYGFS